MKVKKMFLMLLFCASSMIVFTSCNKENKIVEKWKIYLVEKYTWLSYKEPYLQKRFESLFPNPNDDQKYCYSIAKKALSGATLFCFKDDDSMFDALKKYLELGKCGQKAKSNPELYAKNACKIIGPINDFKKELSSHAKVEKVYSEKDTKFNRYLVLYSIEGWNIVRYFICLITEIGDGRSEFQELKNSTSINEILNEWAYLVEG